jgi:nicotinamide mononucleotide transporter
MDLQEVLLRLLKAQIEIGSSVILWREIIGNGFGLASALLGMWRKVAAWPVGIVGNVLLFTVFVGTAIGGPFDTPQKLDLWGQAGRQIFFIIVSVYGWVRWYQYRKSHAEEGVGVRPKWAGARGRLQLLIGAAVPHRDLLRRVAGAGVVGPAGRRLDLDRFHPGDLRHGARLG